MLPRFKFKKTAPKVTSSEDTTDKSKSSKEKSSDSFKSAEGEFEPLQHSIYSTAAYTSMLNWSLGDSFYLLLICLVHVIFDVLKLSLNLESLFSFNFSAEKKSDLKEYKSLLLSFEALSLLTQGTLIAWRCPKMQNSVAAFFSWELKENKDSRFNDNFNTSNMTWTRQKRQVQKSSF